MIVENLLPRALERLAVIEAGAPVRDAAALMSKPHTDLIVVCDNGEMAGVLTKTDIVGEIGRCMGAGCTARVDSIMTRDVTYCRTHEILLDVWAVMKERVCNVFQSSTKHAGRSASSMRGKPCRLCCPSQRTRMSCFATTSPGSGIGKLSDVPPPVAGMEQKLVGYRDASGSPSLGVLLRPASSDMDRIC